MGKERSDSAGIGLSIVQQIVDVHGGSLHVSNLHPHGARFRICFTPLQDPGQVSYHA